MSSLLLYGSLIVVLIATVLAANPLGLTTRPRAVAAWATGIALLVGTLSWPPPATRSARGNRLIDVAMPRYQFGERHRTKICAAPERIAAAVRQVPPEEIRWLGLLTYVRGIYQAAGGDGEEGKSFLEVAQEANFVLLADTPAELVLGTAGRFWRMRSPAQAGEAAAGERLQAVKGDASGFAALDAGVPKAVMNFLIEPADFGCQLVTTETRIHTASPEAQRKFAAYWRVIQPGSALLRRTWLDAIRARAEGASH